MPKKIYGEKALDLIGEIYRLNMDQQQNSRELKKGRITHTHNSRSSSVSIIRERMSVMRKYVDKQWQSMLSTVYGERLGTVRVKLFKRVADDIGY
ncbi:hypothetical protein TNCV_1938861 [Trichonephila clavipes]|nr:hypothetical protein TNCV_1938861 [Trichonephila clavipes]